MHDSSRHSLAFARAGREKMKCYLSEKLKLIIKKNYQIFKIEDRGIDFLGYVIRHKYVLLRKGIKNRLFKKIYKIKNTNIIKSISS